MADPALSAANFIRDIHYNADLRSRYYDVLNAPDTSELKLSKFNQFVFENGYFFPFEFLGIGWRILCSQSLVGWRTIYALEAIDKSDISHSLVIVGSRTGKCKIFFDGTDIIGFTNNFKANKNISWTIGSCNVDFNCTLSFSHQLTGDEPDFGVRVVNATIWSKDQSPPSNYTHRGFDLLNDPGIFNAEYSTVVPDSDSNDSESTSNSDDDVVQDGPKVSITVDKTQTPAKATVKIFGSDGKYHTAAKAVDYKNNFIYWTKENNDDRDDGTNKVISDKDTLAWSQGWVALSWVYNPPPDFSSTSGANFSLHFSGKTKNDNDDKPQDVAGATTKPVEPSKDTSQHEKTMETLTIVALILSISIASTTLTMNSFSIIKSLHDFTVWVKKTFFAKDPDVGDQDEAAAAAAITTAQAATGGVPPEIQAAGIPDPSDTSTFHMEKDSNGENVKTPDKQDVLQEPCQSSSSNVALAKSPRDGDPVMRFEVVHRDGTYFDNVDKLPKISSPILNIETNQEMEVRIAGPQFIRGLNICNRLVQEALVGDGEALKDWDVEVLESRL